MSHHKFAFFQTVVLLSGITAASPVPAQPSGRLELIQESSFSLPRGFEVTGATLSENGSVVVWSRENSAVIWTDGESTKRLCPDQAIDPLASVVVNPPSGIEIVDGRTGRLILARLTGGCRWGRRLGPRGTIVAAAYHRRTSQWIALLSRGALSMLGGPRGRNEASQAPVPVSAAELPTMHMTPSATGVILSSLKAPYEWVSISTDGVPLMRGRPFMTDTTVASGSDFRASAGFLGMSTHHIDSGYVQLLADPKSDLRVIVVYATNAEVTRRTTLDVPIGILDFQPTTKRLLALRRTDELELVTYRLRRTSP